MYRNEPVWDDVSWGMLFEDGGVLVLTGVCAHIRNRNSVDFMTLWFEMAHGTIQFIRLYHSAVSVLIKF